MSVEVYAPATLADMCFLVDNMRPEDREEIMAIQPAGTTNDQLVGRAMQFAERGPQLVHKVGGEPVAVQGIVQLWPGVWSCYAWGTERWPKAVLSLTKTSKRVILPYMQAHRAHRAQAVSLGTHHSAHRWLELLGFEREGRLVRFGREGQDFVIFALNPMETPTHVLRQRP
jgi:hypothetical protein